MGLTVRVIYRMRFDFDAVIFIHVLGFCSVVRTLPVKLIRSAPVDVVAEGRPLPVRCLRVGVPVHRASNPWESPAEPFRCIDLICSCDASHCCWGFGGVCTKVLSVLVNVLILFDT